MSTPPFIAFASHPALRQRFCEARAMLAFSHPDGPVIWANAAGAKLFGYGLPGDATGALLSDQVTRRQFIAAAEGLRQPGDRRNLTIHVPHHFKRVAKQASASLFMLGGRRCFLLDCESEGYDEDSLIAGPDGLNLALVDSDGNITLGADALPSAVLESADTGDMIAALRAGGESYTERPISDETGVWPVALGWLSNSPPLFLLTVSPQLSGAAGPDHLPRPAAHLAAVHRPARDVIAAIDESLAAVAPAPRRDGGNARPVVRKQPQAETAPPQPTPPQAEKHPLPLRFIWRTDIDGRITEVSGELVEAVGPQTGAITGLTFGEIESQLGVTGAGAIGDLLSGAETWSGRTVDWPVSGSDMLVPVDLAALPTFTRERHFDGFRGFGLVRLDEQHKRPEPAHPAPPEPATLEQPVSEQAISKHAERPAALTEDERFALSEIANRLRAENPEEIPSAPPEKSAAVIRRTTAAPPRQEQASDLDTARFAASEDAVVVQSGERVLYANPAFLRLSGYASLDAVIAAGGTDAFVERGGDDRLFLRTASGDKIPVSFHMQAIGWNGGRALALTLRPEDEEALPSAMPVVRRAPEIESAPSPAPLPETETATDAQVAELSSMLDTATDGILILDGERRISSLSASASALFAADTAEVAGEPVEILFAGESHGDIEAQLDRLQHQRAGDVAAEGLEVIGRESGGGLIPLFVTFGRLPQSSGICMVLCDITALKRRDDDLRAARRDARQAEDARDDFVSALRYEVRQPLDAIVSLSETMDHQAFGTIGDTRYHAIAREIASKGRQARGVIGRLLGEPEPAPLTAPPPAAAHEPEKQPGKTEAARINDAVAEAVSMVQPRANSRRIIIRAALSSSIGNAQGSFETLKEIAHELLLGAVQFTPAGGQVVVSTALTPEGGTVLRFRDNGIAPSRRRAVHGGARPQASEPDNSHLARARTLSESLGARLVMQGIPNEGMLVEVFLPERQARPLSH